MKCVHNDIDIYRWRIISKMTKRELNMTLDSYYISLNSGNSYFKLSTKDQHCVYLFQGNLFQGNLSKRTMNSKLHKM